MTDRTSGESNRPTGRSEAPTSLTPARDALMRDALVSGDLMTPNERRGVHWGIHHALANPSKVIAALVEAHGLDACLEALGGSYDSTELDDGADTDDEVWVAVWSFPTKETTDE